MIAWGWTNEEGQTKCIANILAVIEKKRHQQHGLRYLFSICVDSWWNKKKSQLMNGDSIN